MSKAKGTDAVEYMDTLLTSGEINESNIRIALISEIIRARQEKGMSQEELASLSGVSQPTIARLEKGVASPSFDVLLKVLAPLGKTLGVIPLEKRRPKTWRDAEERLSGEKNSKNKKKKADSAQ